MSDPRERHLIRRFVFPILTAAAVVGTLLTPAPAGAASGVQRTAAAISVRAAKKTPGQLRAFWTPARLSRAAEHPLDTGPQPAPRLGGTHTAAPTRAEASPVASADAVPPKDSATSPSNSSFSPLATVSRSVRASDVAAWPTSAVGRMFFSDQAGEKWYTCTATSITSNKGNAVWTAGHCLHRGSGGDAGWYANHIFIPAYALASNPYGWWYGVSLLVHNDWSDSQDRNSADMGAVIVTPETGSARLQDTVGAWGYTFDGSTGYTNVRAYGYASKGYSRPDSDFAEGEYMMYCEGNTVDAADLNPFDNRLKMACDMGAGASGGPIVSGIGSGPRIVGTLSHRSVDTNGNYIDNWLYSSSHFLIASVLINAVNNG